MHRLEFLALKWAVCEKFRHGLKKHTFTVWTENNPQTHILTKPKLEDCEQRWMAKLAAFDFNLKYVPGPENVVADMLSREPFTGHCIGERQLCEPHENLLHESEKLSDGEVQDVFRWASALRRPGRERTPPQRSSDEVATSLSVMPHHVLDRVAAARVKAIGFASHVQSVTYIGQDALLSIPKYDLVANQRADTELACVFFDVEHHHLTIQMGLTQ